MFLVRRFNFWVLLLVAGAIVAVQQLRPWAEHLYPSLVPLFGVAPNLVAGLGLPFAWAAGARRTRMEHWRNCLVTVIALSAYELAQGAGLVLGHPRFDPNDVYASIAGALIAGAVGWRRRPTPGVGSAAPVS